jgi:hypothetical protein
MEDRFRAQGKTFKREDYPTTDMLTDEEAAALQKA